MFGQLIIRRLPESLVNRIAAGEVVERPAAAVKELAENALDAGATRIEVCCATAGQSLIRVTDNGRGMTRDEFSLAIERHATSKLPDEDLWNIHSFGFRGEALPSIGAVSRLSITSRARGSDEAWRIEIEGGEVTPPRPASLAEGTQVEVRDLFLPRLRGSNFSRPCAPKTTMRGEAIERLAMAHPQVDFTWQEDDKRPVRFARTDEDDENSSFFGDNDASGTGALPRRLADVLGIEFIENAVAVSAQREGYAFSGYAGTADAASPDFARAVSFRQRTAGA